MSNNLPITKLVQGSVSEIALVCGDPERAAKIATQLDAVEALSKNREYHTYQGNYNGRTITVCSHGVGAPGAAIAFEELIAAGAKTILRVGSCGGIQPHVQAGHLVIVQAAVQHTGYGREIAPAGYPAVATPEVVVALQQAAAALRHPAFSGLVLTRDAFYGGVLTGHTPSYEIMAQANVLAVEMECAALFLVGSLRGIRTGAILAVDGNVLHTQESMDTYAPHARVAQQAMETAIQTALTAVTML
jgi:uridine phosphorylase